MWNFISTEKAEFCIKKHRMVMGIKPWEFDQYIKDCLFVIELNKQVDRFYNEFFTSLVKHL